MVNEMRSFLADSGELCLPTIAILVSRTLLREVFTPAIGLNGSNREIRFHDLEEQPSIPPCAVLIGVDLDEAAIRELLVGRGQEQDHSKPQ